MDIFCVDVKTRTSSHGINQLRKRRNTVGSNACKPSVPDAQAADLRKRHPGYRSKAIRRTINRAVMHDNQVAIRGGADITLNQVHPEAQRIAGSGYRVFWSSLGTPSMTRNQKTFGLF